ncbi:MAG: cobalt-precorrin-8 methylmutase, partial [Pseudomonadota bacterium]
MAEFKIQLPAIAQGDNIEELSLATIENEANQYPKFADFSYEQKEVIKRQIHATTCFEEILNNIYFTKNAIFKLKELLISGATIIVDTNMINSGLSDRYTKRFANSVVCYVNEPKVFEIAKQTEQTRSFAAVELAIKENLDNPIILACGNAPTFLYSAINTLIKCGKDLNSVA